MTLGERMKEYEFQARTRLLRRTPVIIRLDGKAFHTFTRGFDKPFDESLMKIMQKTTLDLCSSIQGCVFGYTQSDEITLVLVDYKELETCAWFDNQVQKMTSVAASMCTNYFNRALADEIEWLKAQREFGAKINLLQDKMFKATFDARVFNLPQHEVCNNIIWRQQDAVRNSIQSLAQSLYPHKELQGLKCNDLQDKMFTEKGINWNELSAPKKRGTAVLKDENGEWKIDTNMPTITENRAYINDLVYLDY